LTALGLCPHPIGIRCGEIGYFHRPLRRREDTRAGDVDPETIRGITLLAWQQVLKASVLVPVYDVIGWW
jgi:hypothetical protein